MKSLVKLIVIAIAIGAVAAVPAQPGKKPAHKAATAPKCSVCSMPLTAKKDATHTVAVKIKGKTWYCCSACKMKK
jgi:hypothetical protein